MDSTVDAMEAAYDAILEALAVAVAVREPGAGRAAALEDLNRCRLVFYESCDRAEDLVRTAAAGLGSSPSAADGVDALFDTLDSIKKDLVQAAAADVDEREEMEVEEQKDSASTPPAPVAAQDE